MGIIEGLTNLPADFKSALLIETPRVGGVKNVRQSSPFEPLQNDEIELVIAIEVDKSNDVRMCQSTALGGFLLQRPKRVAAGGQFG